MAEEIIEEVNKPAEEETKTVENKNFKKPFDKNKKGERRAKREDYDGIDKVVIQSRFVSKTTKGGRTRKVSSLVVVGDRKGKVGVGTGKATDFPQATDKATADARRNMKKINLVNGTIPHEVIGTFGTSKVVMFPAPEGTGVIAGGGARNLLELCGIKNITCKSFGSRNSINNIKAAMNALLKLQSAEEVALKRGKKPEEI